MDRYSSAAFPVYCCRNVISARNKLPQEAGFIWWFRFNYSLSSTIWNQCSWRKNGCCPQWNGSSETSMERKRRCRSSFCASAVAITSSTKQSPSLGLDCRVCGPGDPWESHVMCDFCCNTAGQWHVCSICRWWTRALRTQGLITHKQCKISVIQNCNTVFKTWKLTQQLANLLWTTNLYNMVRNKELHLLYFIFNIKHVSALHRYIFVGSLLPL